MGTGSFPGVESGRVVTLTPHPLLVPRSGKKSRAVPLLSIRAFVACIKVKTTNYLDDLYRMAILKDRNILRSIAIACFISEVL
jgi:hypothetical protein